MPRPCRQIELTPPQGFESDLQRLVINHLRVAHEELKDIEWFSWDTYSTVYSVSVGISASCKFHSLRSTRIEYKYLG